MGLVLISSTEGHRRHRITGEYHLETTARGKGNTLRPQYMYLFLIRFFVLVHLKQSKTMMMTTIIITNCRKVYTARPPPDWKMVWDHELHFQMHYGDGMKNAALKQARAEAIKEGAFDYHSPLGQGFTFSDDDPSQNFNPYAKYAVQGPRTVTFEYTESYVEGNNLRESVRKRDRVVEDLHGRRDARHQRQAEQHVRRQQHRYNSAFARRSEQECIIL